MGVGLETVELAVQQQKTGGPGVLVFGAARLPAVAEEVLRAVDRNTGERAERGQAADGDRRTDSARVRHEQGADAVESGGELGRRVRAPGAFPGGAGGVRLGIGVGILAGDQLERLQVLRGELVAQDEPVAGAGRLVETEAGVVVVDGLRGVGVQGARVDVGAVGEYERIGGQEPLDDRARGGVGGERAYARRRAARGHSR